MNTCSYMLYKANPYITGKLKTNNTKGSNNDFNVSKLKNSPGEIKRQEIALMKITTPHTANNTSKNRFADKCFLSIEAIAYKADIKTVAGTIISSTVRLNVQKPTKNSMITEIATLSFNNFLNDNLE